MKGIKGGFLPMILAVLGLVLYVTMFDTVMTAMDTLYATTGVSSFIAFATVLGITPTILLLGGTVGAGILYWKGQQQAGTSDTSGLLRMVFGVLTVILFITLFSTIITNFATLYTSYGSNTTWIAFGTVVSILPTILFLCGIFAGSSTAVSGYRARSRRKALL